ncbi:MAG TPA: aminotransferase class I/II-fold pyridoxal phosphate-dependent enzyme [Thermoanaerobaculaceae bacterium]|nr:aminotransferase class I/II-fold pyridoxal phosphate-dependent enzyme [Thermoanaerobaculaceae bacterium]HPS77863.1 aminotransferase class I/II-fold pyridoxal phosphate-dependent enzyme [Thermoanaerobaculaceae bacterium]
MSESYKGFNSTAVHAGLDPREHRGAVSVPIYQSSTFAFPSAEEGAARFAGESPGPIYTRLGNPTIQALERCVAELEGGVGAIGTATGMAAVSTVLLALLRQGDHLVGTHPLYGPSRGVVDKYFSRLGVSSTFVPAADTTALAAAVRPETRLIYIETPANPTMDLVDLPAAVAIAHKAGVPLVVDNTFAGPHLQRPLAMGAEIVLHSMTKSLNGHADVVAGIVVSRERALLAVCRDAATTFGFTMDPHQAWLVLRGIRTLGMRVERAQENAIRLASWLEGHPAVAWVRYPGLISHPQFELAKKQMLGPGSVIAFELRGGIEAGRRLMNSVKLITLAVSLGGIETLIEHPASMTHKGVPEQERLLQGITPGLVRLAVGCEDVEDLRVDLEQALAHLDGDTGTPVIP